jgi:hypothetical protein
MADMSPGEALLAARAAGIQISADGDDLALESAAEPPVAIVALLTEHKAGILTILRSGDAAWSAEDPQTEVAEAATASTPIIASGSTDNIASGPTDNIASGSADNIGSASSDIAGLAASEFVGSAATDITGSASIITAAEITALRRPQRDEWSTDDWQAFFDERVGIAEFDGGLPRSAAETRAFDCCVAEWLYRAAVITAPAPCPICDDADRPNDPLLPIGIVGGRAWLHIGCVKAWCAGRKAEAVAALASIGIRRPGGSST